MANDPNATTPVVGAARTGAQVGLPSALIVLGQAFHWINWDATQTAAVLAVATIAIAFVQKWIERRAGKALGAG